MKSEEDIPDDDLDEMNDIDEAKRVSPRLDNLDKGPQTYKFADLAELIVEKNDDDLEFDDELESNSDSDYDDSETGLSTG